MKILFLDIDGVLNSLAWAVDCKHGFGCPPGKDRQPTTEILKWDPAAVRMLRRIIEQTGAKIVVMSSWRGYGAQARDKWESMFACYDWEQAPVIGETPDLNRFENGVWISHIRGDEVDAWMKAFNGKIESYVCLDDESDFRPDPPLVKTDMRFGLTGIEMQECIRRLSTSGDDNHG